jgi:hypothetical protein
MGVLVPIGSVLELKAYTRLQSQNGINVLHYRVSALIGPAISDQAIVSVLDGAAAPLYQAWLPATARYSGLRLQIIAPLPVQAAVIATADAGAGSVASDALPAQTALVVTKRTVLAGRRNRGRAYLPFWPESMNDANGQPTAAAIGLATDWATFFLNPINVAVGPSTVTLTPVLFRKLTLTTVDLFSAQVRVQWGTQRRRSQINKGDIPGP